MEKLVKLFEPGKIGKLELKNRIVSAPLGRGLLWCTRPEGNLTDRYLAYFETRAKGGAGLIILSVNVLAPPYAPRYGYSFGSLTIDSDEHIPDARRFTQALHAHGAKVSFLISHFAHVSPQLSGPGAEQDFVITGSPSSLRDARNGTISHSVSAPEIREMIEAYGPAVRRGKAAGFDAVTIYGCHHGLIHEFLSPRSNQRTDEYGGTVEKRARLACEVISRVRKEAGPDFPIIIRMNGSDFLEGGVTLDEAVVHARLFVEAGADVLDVSSGPPETAHWQYPTMYQPWAPLLPLAAAIKKATKATVFTVAKLDVLHGEQILREGSADFIQLGRALMADPELPNKAREGRLNDIVPCLYCGHCQDWAPDQISSTCTVNPAFGREREYKLKPADRKKNVMVIGGGPGGMQAAWTLAERGHDVSLYEKTDKLGGQWQILANYRPEQKRLIDYLSHGLEKTNVKVFLNQVVTARMVEPLKPDAVVVATGSTPTRLDIPGINGKIVVQATDVLTGKVDVGQEVVVVGGRVVGLNAALFLAERDKSVSVISKRDIARGLARNSKMALTELLVSSRIRLYPYTIADSVTEKGLNVWWNSEQKDNIFFFLKADTIILAVGAENDNSLADELTGMMPEVYPIGDCAGKRNLFAAIRGGIDVGQKI